MHAQIVSATRTAPPPVTPAAPPPVTLSRADRLRWIADRCAIIRSDADALRPEPRSGYEETVKKADDLHRRAGRLYDDMRKLADDGVNVTFEGLAPPEPYEAYEASAQRYYEMLRELLQHVRALMPGILNAFKIITLQPCPMLADSDWNTFHAELRLIGNGALRLLENADAAKVKAADAAKRLRITIAHVYKQVKKKLLTLTEAGVQDYQTNHSRPANRRNPNTPKAKAKRNNTKFINGIQ